MASVYGISPEANRQIIAYMLVGTETNAVHSHILNELYVVG